MPRIVGVDIPNQKIMPIALTYIHGIGRTTAARILKVTNIDLTRKAKDLTDDEISRVTAHIEQHVTVEGPLRRQVQANIARLKDIACYRGLRHRKGLPVRGQRTRTNARSRKGPKRTVAGKRAVKQMR